VTDLELQLLELKETEDLGRQLLTSFSTRALVFSGVVLSERVSDVLKIIKSLDTVIHDDAH
jgi:hypothetical protein